MALSTVVTRCLLTSKQSYISRFNRLLPFSFTYSHTSVPISIPEAPFVAPLVGYRSSFTRPFCSSETPIAPPPEPKRNTKVNFSLSDSDSDAETDSDSDKSGKTQTSRKEIDKSKLPPPYDPFNKKPAIEEPEDPKNLQEVFHKIRSDGLMNSAVKMFDGLSKDGLTHEALELFSVIKDKGQMPDVVAHTAVIEAYANAGQAKEAHKIYLRMLSSGVLPNAYTYSVVIKGLAASGEEKMVKEAKKILAEMVEKRGMMPNAATCVAAFEGFVKLGLEDEGRELVGILKNKGFLPQEGKVREVMKDKRGRIYRTVMSALCGK